MPVPLEGALVVPGGVVVGLLELVVGVLVEPTATLSPVDGAFEVATVLPPFGMFFALVPALPALTAAVLLGVPAAAVDAPEVPLLVAADVL